MKYIRYNFRWVNGVPCPKIFFLVILATVELVYFRDEGIDRHSYQEDCLEHMLFLR
jgi:hypothetical protein